ncbi:DNA sulfur modification protein DndE [Patescibacteria group bacterium]|nr:DNA sulfur modification protein DndE [Patescibacteria group bacterium]
MLLVAELLPRIRVSNDATFKLRAVQSKTGLTPNILLRVGFGLSLRDESLIDPKKYPEDGRELNRYTITGEFDIGFVTLLKEWMTQKRISTSNDNLVEYFRAHLNRGAILLSGRVKSLEDLALLD